MNKPHDIEVTLKFEDGTSIHGTMKWEIIKTLKLEHGVDGINQIYEMLLMEYENKTKKI